MADDHPTRAELLELYKAHVEEYRFQVQLNNQRLQWYVTLDVALVTIGTGLLRLGGQDQAEGRFLTALVFTVGAVLAVMATAAVALQVRYQHQARAQAERVAAELDVVDLAVGSTPGFLEARHGTRSRRLKVRQLHYTLLGFLAAVNAVGAVYVATR